MRRFMFTAAGLALLTSAAGSQVRKEAIDGIRNFTVVDPSVGCAGATEARAIRILKARGYVAIVNLRRATEAGAAIDESRAAAEAAGIKFIHIPFDTSAPDEAAVDAFLKAVTDPANQPVFIHCGSGSRASALWLTKRMLVDGWDEARALEEAREIGPPSDALQKFALAYVAAHRR